MSLALDKLTVLDFSRVLAGPLCTMVLADFGARVIKVERPGMGDDTRQWGPPYAPDGQATYFQAVNRNKDSLVVDLADERDLTLVRRLARTADVLVENFRPDLMDRLGLGYDELAAENRGLIYCSITGFGGGAGAVLPGYDLLVQAVGGLMSITGTSDGEPQKVGVALVDVITGLFATAGILTALAYRAETGEGQRVEVDLLSSLLAALVNQGSAFTQAGVVPRRMGNAHPSITPYDLYPTGDGDLVLAVGNDRQFACLCRVLEAPRLADDERFVTNDQRVRNRAALRSELESLLGRRPAREWAELLTTARVPAGTVNDIGQAFALANRLGLDPIVEIPAATGSTVALTRNPIRLSRTPASYRKPPPALGGAGPEPQDGAALAQRRRQRRHQDGVRTAP
jgi:crotonobetainyl-CoA:carnitine CoA-transferase CaiB-like acyl-CoA transferase